MTNKETEQPSAADRVIEARIKAEEVKATLDGLGGSAKPPEGDSLSVTIVKASMEQQTAILNQLTNQITQVHKDLDAARLEREQAQTQLYNERISILQQQKQELDQKAQEAKGAGVPPSQLDIYRSVRLELQKEIDELKKDQPEPLPLSVKGMSDETQIRLKEMELEQARILTEMTLSREEKEKEWDLKLRQFDDEAKLRWAEYKDKKDFREKGLEGFEDLAHSVAEGITREREGGGSVKSRKSGKEETIEASIRGFACQFCGTKIPVKPGDELVTCPNEECGAQYEVKVRAR